jgi:hypothetical protein
MGGLLNLHYSGFTFNNGNTTGAFTIDKGEVLENSADFASTASWMLTLVCKNHRPHDDEMEV